MFQVYSEKLITKYKAYCIQFELVKPYFDMTLYCKTAIFTPDYYFDFYIKLIGLLSINFFWSRKTDHAGLNLEILFFGLLFYFKVYDARHWDYENDRYEQL